MNLSCGDCKVIQPFERSKDDCAWICTVCGWPLIPPQTTLLRRDGLDFPDLSTPDMKPTKRSGREILDELADYLNTGEDSEEVWNIITALRGPDSNNESLKDLSTARVRGVLGLNQDGFLHGYSISKEELNTETDGYEAAEQKIIGSPRSFNSGHFFAHIKNAERALIKLGYIKPRPPKPGKQIFQYNPF